MDGGSTPPTSTTQANREWLVFFSFADAFRAPWATCGLASAPLHPSHAAVACLHRRSANKACKARRINRDVGEHRPLLALGVAQPVGELSIVHGDQVPGEERVGVPVPVDHNIVGPETPHLQRRSSVAFCDLPHAGGPGLLRPRHEVILYR